jgi:general L-amino acid transport system permease protein
MTTSQELKPSTHKKRSLIGRLWFDKRSRAMIVQVIIIAVVALFIAFIWHNTYENLKQLGVSSGFDFLWQSSGYDINQHLIPYSSVSTHFDAYTVGLINTLLVAVAGCALATLIGFIGGVLRLSNNWLISRISYCYVEFTRNVPVLLQILLWYGIILKLPMVRSAIELAPGFHISNRGLVMPLPIIEPGFAATPIAFVIATVGAILFSRWARKRQDETGKTLPAVWVGTGLILGLPILTFLLTGLPLSFEYPEMKGFNFVGGMYLRPEFVALTWALSIYTGAFIAEIVRAGIQSVNHGQAEAAFALGLRPTWSMRLIILPQALRVIIPPLTSQYLNLTKNSSLAIAIGYMDIVATVGGITLNQTGQALECIAMVMLTYLIFSLTISAGMNFYNKRVALVER